MDDTATDARTSTMSSGLATHAHGSQCLTQQLTTFLLGRTNLDEVCQFCVLDLLAPLRPWQMSIYAVGSDSLFRIRGSFGRSDGQGSLHEHSCLDDLHVGEKLRHGLPLANFPILSSKTAQTTTISDLDDGPQVLWPLRTTHRLVGVIQIRFSSVPDAHILNDAMASISAPVTLALDLATSRNRRASDLAAADVGRVKPAVSVDHPALSRLGEPPSGDHLTLVPAISEPRVNGTAALNGNSNNPNATPHTDHNGRLTPRQQRVLELMAKGMTNGQIARVLAFSESTVRQETMAIYRMLKVPGRTEAVVAGRELGLLPGHDRA